MCDSSMPSMCARRLAHPIACLQDTQHDASSQDVVVENELVHSVGNDWASKLNLDNPHLPSKLNLDRPLKP